MNRDCQFLRDYSKPKTNSRKWKTRKLENSSVIPGELDEIFFAEASIGGLLYAHDGCLRRLRCKGASVLYAAGNGGNN